MTFKYTSLINIGLRGLISISKFILTLVLASNFDLSVLGEYSLVVNTILLATFILGFEVYQYTNRSIITEPKDQSRYIQQHFFYIFTVFLYISPLFYLFFLFGVLKMNYLIPLYILLLFEVISNEQYRLLIALKHPIFANIVLFIRTSLWIYLFLIFLQFDKIDGDPLLVIFELWATGAFISLLLPLIYCIIMHKGSWVHVKKFPRFSLIISYWKKSYVLFFASIAMLLLNVVDKFVVDLFVGKKMLGVYALFFSLSSVIFTFVMAGIISIAYPYLVEAYKTDQNRYRVELKQFSKRLLLSSSLMGLISIFVLVGYLYYNSQNTQKYNLFIEHLSAYILLWISFIVYTLHMKFHYELYAANKDAAIMKSNYLMLAIYVVTLIPFTYFYSIVGTACAHLIASITVLVLKRYCVKKTDPDKYFVQI